MKPLRPIAAFTMALGMACADGSVDVPAPSAALAVAVTTEGHTLDPDGYELVLRDTVVQLAAQDSLVVNIPAGLIRLTLQKVARNCAAPPEAYLLLRPGDTLRTDIQVTCDSALSNVILYFRRVQRQSGGLAWDLWMVRPDGTGHALLRPEVSGAGLTPDGTEIVLSSSSNSGIKVMSVDGDQERSVPLGEGHWASSASLSADGRRVAFTTPGVNTGFQVAVVDVQAGGARRVSNHDRSFMPSWAPNSRHVYFNSCCEPGDGILMADLDAGTVQRFGPEGANSPQVSPDGQTVLFFYPGYYPSPLPRGHYTLPVGGGTPEPVTVLPEEAWGVRWSPEGDSFLVTISGATGDDVWIIPRDPGRPWSLLTATGDARGEGWFR